MQEANASSGLSRSQNDPNGHGSSAIWLTQLRWIAVAGQLLVIGFVYFVLKIELPIVSMLALVLCTVASNVALWFVARRSLNASSEMPIDRQANSGQSFGVSFGIHHGSVGSRTLGGLLLFDVMILTGLLYLSGGAANPFILFYVANIVVAGVVLSRFWAIAISAASVLGAFFLLNRATPNVVFANSPLAADSPWDVTKAAFLIAFTTCCGVLAYFVSMLALQVRQRDRRLAIAEKERERAQRLEALATLAAGAGHELASPLSTIAVIAGELSRTLDKQDIPDKVRRDFGLIREELNRCKDILHRMKSGAGEAAAEHLHPVRVQEILDETVIAMREPQRVHIAMERAVADFKALLPKQALSQALRNLLQNGLDASKPNQHVDVNSTIHRAENDQRTWVLEIADQGSGMTDDVLRRIGEPFFTTKEVGEGMGLGVFLTRNVIQGLGGTLRFSRTPNGGTQCVVRIPLGSQ